MVCIYCSSETHVINSRSQKRSNSIWRRRKCLNCSSVFSTTEHIDYEKSWVVQYSDSKKLPFLRDLLYISIYKSLQHRQSSTLDAAGLTATIISSLQKYQANGCLPAAAIATITLDCLKRFDAAAATYYQAFHGDVL